MPRSRFIQCIKCIKGLSGWLLVSGALLTGNAAAEVESLWRLDLDASRQGQVYQTLIMPGTTPRVVATTSREVFAVEGGKAATMIQLERGGGQGERALLPAQIPAEAPTRIGILVHNHHAVDRFELRDLNGETVARVADPRHFHYRLAPDGRSVVGIDAGDTHTALTAEQAVYRFFDAQGGTAKDRQVNSPRPALSFDSAYSPDGRAFVVNSQRQGLRAFDPTSGELLWQTEQGASRFAAADGVTGLVVAVPVDQRQRAVIYRRGQPLGRVDLRALGLEGNVRNVAVSPNGQFVVVTSREQVLMLAGDSAELLGQFDVTPGFAINSLAISNRGIVAVGAQGPALDGGEIQLLDARSGEPLAPSQKTVHQRSNAWIPTVQFDATGTYLLVRTLERLDLYAWTDER